MAHQVRTNFSLTQLPLGGGTETQRIEGVDVVVTLSNEEYLRLPSDIFSDGALDYVGPVADGGDQVVTQATTVAAPVALTSPATFNATTYTASEVNALRVDVNNLRTTLVNTLAALKGTGKPMA
jgi:hypothetical protein